MQRIVVTGRHGQIAQACAEVAGSIGVEVIRLGRPEFDLERPDNLGVALAAAQPDAILAVAAYTDVDKAETDRDRAWAVNAIAAGSVARAAQALGVPLVQVSTDYVFDGRNEGLYRPGDATDPLNVYGASKLAGEAEVAKVGGDHAIVRLGWLFSPVGRNFVTAVLARAKAAATVQMVDDQVGCPTYAPDAARCLLRICRNLLEQRDSPALRGLFHLAEGPGVSRIEYTRAIVEGSRERGGPWAQIEGISTASVASKARRPLNSSLDGGALVLAHGVSLRPWREGLQVCLDRLIGTSETRSAAAGPLAER